MVDPEYLRLLRRAETEEEQITLLRAISEKKPFAEFLKEQPMRKRTSSIQPIETTYHGHRFRSRMEVRWACFFEALGMPYTYETEGFDLGKAGRYLPDFFLPQCETWIEVKPVDPSPGEREKARALACARDEYVDIVVGVPDLWEQRRSGQGQVLHCFPGSTPPGLQQWHTLQQCFGHWCSSEQFEMPWRDKALTYAVQQARGARFEHGETPQLYNAWRRAEYEYHGGNWERAVAEGEFERSCREGDV